MTLLETTPAQPHAVSTPLDCPESPDLYNEDVDIFLLKQWKKQQPHICSVCLDNADVSNYPILKCSNLACDVSVHRECYGIETSEAPDLKQWRCLSCLDNETDDNDCVLCPSRGGAIRLDSKRNSWVHTTCAIWLPDVKISTSTGYDISKISMSSWSQYCYLCEDRHVSGIGACLSCAHPACKNSFHVTCASKWNLLDEALPKPSGQGFDTFCHEHSCSKSCNRKMNAWETWRALKVNLRENFEVARAKVQRNSLMLTEGITSDEVQEPNIFENATEITAIQRRYEIYDLERTKRTDTLSADNVRLYGERRRLEEDIVNLHVERKALDGHLCSLRSANGRMKRAITGVQESLLRLHSATMINGWAWNALSANATDARVSRTKEMLSLSQAQILQFVLKLNPKAPVLGDEFSMVSGLAVELMPMGYPNLSLVTGSVSPALRPITTAVATCKECFTRVLPITAPVLPQFRRTLLSCVKCRSQVHLCCLDPPLSAPPATWECTGCVNRKHPLLKSRAMSDAFKASSSSLNDDFEDELAARKRMKTKKFTSTSRQQPLQEPLPVKKPSKKAVAQAAVFRRQPSVKFIAPETNETMIELRKAIYEVTGPAPKLPESLVLSQNGVYDETSLRSFVFQKVSDQDREQMVLAALWRVVTNIPPGAHPNDVAALKTEGDKHGYGRFAKSFHNANCETSEHSIASLANEFATVECCGSSDAAISEDEASEDEFQAVKRTAAAKYPAKGLKPERVPSLWNGDLYKPFWTRGNGKLKEGWCPLCIPGQWLKTKTSVYWYHMHNFHGVSSIGGTFFQSPVDHRISPHNGLKEGLCHHCKKWIPIQGDKPVNVEEIYWFKHSQKCHRFDVIEEGAADDAMQLE